MDDPRSEASADLTDLLRQARGLLDRCERLRADELLSTAAAHAGGAPLAQQQSLHLLACEAAFLRNDYARVLYHAEAAHEAAHARSDSTGEALALSWSGAALTQQSRYSEALVQLHAAIDALRALGQEPLACRALNYLAIVHEELGDPQQALLTYERSAAMARLAGDDDMLSRALSNLGDAYVGLQRPADALPLLREALTLVEARGDHGHLAWCLLALSRLELDAGRVAEAQALLERAVAPAEASAAGRTLAEVLSALGSLRARRGEKEPALQLLERALQIFEQLGIQREIFRTHFALSEALERLGDFPGALSHHKAYAQIRARVIDQVARGQLASLSARLELEKARAEQEIARLRNVELAELNAQLAHQAQALTELSRRDPLTGLLNRRYLAERLSEEFDRARRYKKPLAVAMADLDRFKRINDDHSHAAGDEVLRRVADVLSSLLRKVDLVARYGGEEFVLVFPETSPEQAIVACEKVRAGVAAVQWGAVAEGLEVTISIGVAGGTDYASWERLLSAADARLYEAKRAGRNRVVAG